MLQHNTFLFHADNKFFPGCTIIEPVYLSVNYSYWAPRNFKQVENVEISYKLLRLIKFNGHNIEQIELAARQHLYQTWTMPKQDDTEDALSGMPENIQTKELK